MGHESLPQGDELNSDASLLDTHGDELVTINGLTLPLKAWFGFCPKPHDEMDPARVEEVARDFLEGRIPSFVQLEESGD